ncbi:MAG: exo-beta-N-acetylmuramidase NamZ domain-containing protein [Acidobacteriota bacterium]
MKKIGFVLFACTGLAVAQELADIRRVIDEAVAAGQLPGAVCLVSHQGRVVHQSVHGSRALVPAVEPMTADTIFDAASLTKVVATTASLMKLVEQGRIRLNDKVTTYLPAYQGGKSDITVRLLLTHFSGLRPDLDLQPAWSGYELGIRKALVDKPVHAPGERFVYSDINFILLGEIVRQVCGRPLDQYAREEIFAPLGMKDTGFRPAAALAPRIAPTEQYPGMTAPLRGVVHDETTRYMGGVAGHAGLFTTADDLAHFAQAILNGGELNGVRIWSPLTVRKFTEPQTPSDQPILRGLGFDLDSPFSANRGELYPIGSVGHTGFTGTSLWIDPATQSYVILLANTVHPKRRPAITPLRAKVATIAAASLGVDAPRSTLTGYNETMAGVRRHVNRAGQVQTGLDVLIGEKFARLQGKRVGLITNHTGLDGAGRPDFLVMREMGVNLTALFSPEHGIFGKEDREDVADAREPQTGIRIYSLYNQANRKPSPAALAELDALVFDIQDMGARFYTYASTMKNALEAAAAAKLPFYVLDRPNPLTGVRVEGPLLDPELQSFIGCHNIPIRHGMTTGELARMFNTELSLNAKLEVVAMKGWQRGDWFDSTGALWVNPSPNLRSLNAALLYPGIAMLEYSKNYSVGRGTDAPFEQIGAEFIRGRQLATTLNSRKIPGVRVYPVRFTPNDSNLKGKTIEGIRFVITDREGFDAVRLGVELAVALERLYPGQINFPANGKLIGSQTLVKEFAAGADPRAIQARLEETLVPFLARRAKFLLY